jgi:hypothetical protein
MNGEGVWMVKDAVKYSLSQIIMLTKLKLRGEGRDIEGIRMKCEGYKTRFTKPFQTVTLEVPYETGIDPYNGLLEVAIELDVVQKKGSWYVFKDQQFRRTDFNTVGEDVMIACQALSDRFLTALVSTDEEETVDQPTSKSRREAKFVGDKQERLDD